MAEHEKQELRLDSWVLVTYHTDSQADVESFLGFGFSSDTRG